jgi:glutathione S-transferase
VQAAFQKAVEKAKSHLVAFESYLADGREFLTGAKFTLADINLSLVVYYLMRAGAQLTSFPYLRKYAMKVKERASIKGTWPPHWQTSNDQDWVTGLL